MRITVNGQEQELGDGTTVLDLLAAHDLHPIRVAVELNESLVKREQFGLTAIQDGDSVEIVTFVGGG